MLGPYSGFGSRGEIDATWTVGMSGSGAYRRRAMARAMVVHIPFSRARRNQAETGAERRQKYIKKNEIYLDFYGK